MQKPINQRASGVTRPGMNDLIDGLVHDDQILVLVDNRHLDVLRHPTGLGFVTRTED